MADQQQQQNDGYEDSKPTYDAYDDDEESFPEPNYDLDLSFNDIGELVLEESLSCSDPTAFTKPSKGGATTAGTVVPDEDYILGTLIVRVVAARDLEAADNSHGLNAMLFGKHHHHYGNPTNKRAGGGGSANPYASVRFGSTTQRTSEVYGTTDPVWPRGEAMYMDVMRPTPQYYATNDSNNSNSSSSSTDASQQQQQQTGDKQPATAHKQDTNNFTATTDQQLQQSHQEPILTVALFHTSFEKHSGKKAETYPNKKRGAGDSDDTFLGMTTVNLTTLLTGKLRGFDEWLLLTGSKQERACVRLTVEYEASDPPPRKGDLVRFAGFCDPADLYPVVVSADGFYEVEEYDGDANVLLSCTSPEGWVSTFLVHRFMLVCEQRHEPWANQYHSEVASIAQRLVHSVAVSAVQDTVRRVPDEGLINVSAKVIEGGASLLTRWLQGGYDVAVQDLAYATNWQGLMNPSAGDFLSTGNLEESSSSSSLEGMTRPSPLSERQTSDSSAENSPKSPTGVALPNMPACPITQEPMRDPVVAADGHTYERSAIVRWYVRLVSTKIVAGSTCLIDLYFLLFNTGSKRATRVH
jgi:hypothetical protein